MGEIRTIFSKEVKLKAIQLYDEGMGYKAIAKQLGLSTHKIVSRWGKHFKTKGIPDWMKNVVRVPFLDQEDLENVL